MAVLIDGIVEGAGGQTVRVVSDAGCRASGEEGDALPTELCRDQLIGDPGFAHLRRRPHPLPATSWLEGSAHSGAVLDLRPDPYAGAGRTEWLRWPLPPGASRVRLPLRGSGRLFVDGVEVDLLDGAADLPSPERGGRVATLRVDGANTTEGALLEGPAEYDITEGVIELGDWSDQGLASWSGGLRMRMTLDLAGLPPTPVHLDLGRVRGTVEAWVNGRSAGVRIMSPYRFDVTGILRAGANDFELLVFNTLSPYLTATSPTPTFAGGQNVSGVFGPVRLVT
jgi:hypothetical protein